MHTYPDEVKKFIEENVKGITSKELTRLINDRFGTDYGANHIRAYMKNHKLTNGLDTCFKKGDIPPNKGVKGYSPPGSEKGWFKKGQDPINHREVGSERITKDGYVEIKVEEPGKWKLKHRFIWEQHNGPVKRNHVVIFLDGNKLNLDISNLAMISRNELKIMNQVGLKYENAEATKAGVMIAKAIDTKNKRRKKRS